LHRAIARAIWPANPKVGLSTPVTRTPAGATPEEALADLREAVTLLIEEVGAPPELTLTLDVA
jgi:hypothetical protein